MTPGLRLYIHVSDWSRQTSGVCVLSIFSSGIEESLFVSVLCSVEFWFVDTSVLKGKKKCYDKFFYSSVFH